MGCPSASLRARAGTITAVLLSPWPESLLAFEPTWARLAEHTHLVAVDFQGFGHSKRSRCADVPPGDGPVRGAHR